MASGTLDGIRAVAFEARRAEELAALLARDGAAVVLLTGVGTRALAGVVGPAAPRPVELRGVPIVARVSRSR